jgi:hypothetical protein
LKHGANAEKKTRFHYTKIINPSKILYGDQKKKKKKKETNKKALP